MYLYAVSQLVPTHETVEVWLDTAESFAVTIALAPAIPTPVKAQGVPSGDVDLWALREAHALATPYNQAQLETPWKLTNVNGGTLTPTHSCGMSGIWYFASASLALGRRGDRCAVMERGTAGGTDTAGYVEQPRPSFCR